MFRVALGTFVSALGIGVLRLNGFADESYSKPWKTWPYAIALFAVALVLLVAGARSLRGLERANAVTRFLAAVLIGFMVGALVLGANHLEIL